MHSERACKAKSWRVRSETCEISRTARLNLPNVLISIAKKLLISFPVFWCTKNVKFHFRGYKTARPKTGDWKWMWHHFRTSSLVKNRFLRHFLTNNTLLYHFLANWLAHNKKITEKFSFATHASTLRRIRKICHIHFNSTVLFIKEAYCIK